MEVEQSKALRVCHISTAHPADDTRVFWREAVGLASLGYDVTLFARDRFTGDRNGVHLVGLPTYDRRLMRMTVGTIRALRAASSVGADIYHVHDPELLPGLAVFHLLRRRTVYDAHELLSAQVLSKQYLPAWARVIAGFVARGLERLAALASDEIITVSPACAIPFPETKTTIVANYPGRDELSISDSDVGGRDEPLRVIYLGGIARSRGILELIEAMSLINRTHAIRLTLIGPFENESMLAEARSHRGWSYVDYLGVLPHAEVGSHLVGAVAGVVNFLPSPHNSVRCFNSSTGKNNWNTWTVRTNG